MVYDPPWDGMRTMTTTQTIVREHEADLVVQEAETVADGVVAPVHEARPQEAGRKDQERRHRKQSER